MDGLLAYNFSYCWWLLFNLLTFLQMDIELIRKYYMYVENSYNAKRNFTVIDSV